MPYDSAPMAPPSDGGMYDDAAPPMEKGEGAEEQQEQGGDTALLPKSILAGKKFEPGDEVVLRIVRFHGDEVEVAYAPEKPGEGDEEKGEGPPPPPPPKGGDEMAGMME